MTVGLTQIVLGHIKNANILVTNGYHLFTDLMAYVISLIAIIKKHKITDSSRKTFGYRRSEALGAIIHGSLLLGIAVSTLTESIVSLASGDVEKMEDAKLVMIVASVSFVVDIIGLLLFWQDDEESVNMNIRSLFLDKVGDVTMTLQGV